MSWKLLRNKTPGAVAAALALLIFASMPTATASAPHGSEGFGWVRGALPSALQTRVSLRDNSMVPSGAGKITYFHGIDLPGDHGGFRRRFVVHQRGQ